MASDVCCVVVVDGGVMVGSGVLATGTGRYIQTYCQHDVHHLDGKSCIVGIVSGADPGGGGGGDFYSECNSKS